LSSDGPSSTGFGDCGAAGARLGVDLMDGTAVALVAGVDVGVGDASGSPVGRPTDGTTGGESSVPSECQLDGGESSSLANSGWMQSSSPSPVAAIRKNFRRRDLGGVSSSRESSTLHLPVGCGCARRGRHFSSRRA
jgi:hypothetical protein